MTLVWIAWVAFVGQPTPAEAEVTGEAVAPEPEPTPEPEPAAEPGPELASVDVVALRSGFEAHVPGEVDTALKKRAALCARSGETVAESDVDATEPERRRAQQRNNDAAGANILADGAGTSTGAERLAAAVDAGIDGVEAGVSISPLALVPSFAPQTPHGPVLLLAALKDGKTRVGGGYGVTVKQSADAAAALQRTACGDVTKRETAITKAVEKALSVSVENAYVSVCEAVVPELAGYEAAACAAGRCEPAKARSERIAASCTTALDVQRLAANTRNLAEDELVTPHLRSAIRSVDAQLETLEAAGVTLTATATGADTKAFMQSYRAMQWSAVSVRLGVDGSVDFARRRFGTRRLEPAGDGEPGTPEELDRGQLLAWRAGPAALLKAGRAQVGLGVTAGRSMRVGSDSMFTDLGPSASLSWLVGFLNDEKVDRKAKYRERTPKFDDDGNLPAHVVLGLRASGSVAITLPRFQEVPLNAATLLVHADFVLTDKLEFRLGVPVTAELVEQRANTDAEPDIPKRTVLRWSVPVVGTTVLAF